VDAEITIPQYIHFTLEENVIHQRFKPDDPSMVPKPQQFGPPIVILRRYHQKEKEAPHLHIGNNKSKT
jgi:hypothetical protein